MDSRPTNKFIAFPVREQLLWRRPTCVYIMADLHLTSILSNLNNFHSLGVVDRVSETQLQVGEKSN